MNENMKIYEQVRAVPSEALKAINGGRLKGMSDINPMWRIKMLTEMFGICGIGWKIEIVDKRLENGSANEIVCFVDINLYIKSDGEWSAPIPGMGGSSFVTQEKNGLYTSDECFKMAYTDAISVACKTLGFAADVYYANDRTKYSNQEESQAKQPEQPKETNWKDKNEQSKQQAQEVGQQKLSEALQRDVMGLMKKRGMGFPDLNEFCTAMLERPVKFFKKDVVDVAELKKIKEAMDDAVGA